MKYRCNNTLCPNYGREEYISSETFSYKEGRLVGSHATCPSCGKEREEINGNADIPLSEKSIGMNFFDGMSVAEKRETLRKRSHEHFTKEIKERKDGMLNQAKKEFSEMRKG